MLKIMRYFLVSSSVFLKLRNLIAFKIFKRLCWRYAIRNHSRTLKFSLHVFIVLFNCFLKILRSFPTLVTPFHCYWFGRLSRVNSSITNSVTQTFYVIRSKRYKTRTRGSSSPISLGLDQINTVVWTESTEPVSFFDSFLRSFSTKITTTGLVDLFLLLNWRTAKINVHGLFSWPLEARRNIVSKAIFVWRNLVFQIVGRPHLWSLN